MDMTTAVIVGAGIALLCYKLGTRHALETRPKRPRNTNEIYNPVIAPVTEPERRVVFRDAPEDNEIVDEMPESIRAYLAHKEAANPSTYAI